MIPRSYHLTFLLVPAPFPYSFLTPHFVIFEVHLRFSLNALRILFLDTTTPLKSFCLTFSILFLFSLYTYSCTISSRLTLLLDYFSFSASPLLTFRSSSILSFLETILKFSNPSILSSWNNIFNHLSIFNFTVWHVNSWFLSLILGECFIILTLILHFSNETLWFQSVFFFSDTFLPNYYLFFQDKMFMVNFNFSITMLWLRFDRCPYFSSSSEWMNNPLSIQFDWENDSNKSWPHANFMWLKNRKKYAFWGRFLKNDQKK